MARRSSSNVERGAEILIELGRADSAGLTLAEIAEAVGDAKSAVHRALSGLVHYGFVEQTSRRGRYRLGPAIYALSAKPNSIRDVVRVIKPALIEITRQSGGSTYLLARAGTDSLCLDMEEGVLPAQSMVKTIGGRIPMGVGAGSICMLAEMDPRAREALIIANEPRLGPYTTPAQIEEAVAFHGQHGYVHFRNYGFYNTMHLAVAVPKRIATSAAVSVILPITPDLDPDAQAAFMRDVIARLT